MQYPVGPDAYNIDGTVRLSAYETLFTLNDEEESVASAILDVLVKAPRDVRRGMYCFKKYFCLYLGVGVCKHMFTCKHVYVGESSFENVKDYIHANKCSPFSCSTNTHTPTH